MNFAVRFATIVWGTVVVVYLAMLLVAPHLVRIPARGSEEGEAVAFALFATLLVFAPAALLMGLKKLKRSIWWQSLTYTAFAAVLLFLLAPGNRALLIQEGVETFRDVPFIVFIAWCAVLGMLTASLSRSEPEAS